MTAARTFIDTNVLVYTVDADEPAKREISLSAIGLLAGNFLLSTQVLGELYVTLTRKLRRPVAAGEAVERITNLSRHRVLGIEASMVRAAIETSQRFQISYWDALIIEAAVAGRCDRILTEDLPTGQAIRGVEIVNPFA